MKKTGIGIIGILIFVVLASGCTNNSSISAAEIINQTKPLLMENSSSNNILYTEQALQVYKTPKKDIPIKGSHVLAVPLAYSNEMNEETQKYYSQRYLPKNENITIFYIQYHTQIPGSRWGYYNALEIANDTTIFVVYWPERTIAGAYIIPATENGSIYTGETDYSYVPWQEWAFNLPGFKPEMKNELEQDVNNNQYWLDRRDEE